MNRWRDSPVLAAVIEVIGLGVIATLIAGYFHRNQVDREHELVAGREYQARRFEAVEQLSALVNRASAHALELIEVTQGPWSRLEAVTAEQRQALDAQRRAVLSDFNAFVREWRVGRSMVGLRIHDYYGGSQRFKEASDDFIELMEAWRHLEATVEEYLLFARNAYLAGAVDLRTESDLREEIQWRLEDLSRRLLRDLLPHHGASAAAGDAESVE